jgi:CheY-like chemotaxis protein
MKMCLTKGKNAVKKRILLVEDNTDAADVIENELKFLGYDIVVATNGIEAVEMAASENPDLIVMDILLPKLNGLNATVQIRNNPSTQFIPILAATAKAMPGDREQCLSVGCDGYLSKPFTHVELDYAIKEILKKTSTAKKILPFSDSLAK